MFKTIKKNMTYQETEKRSRFISYSFKVTSQNDVVNRLNNIKKEHPNAKHCVYGYILHDNSSEKYSDDGEPNGTAGLPILNAIKSMELKNVLVVVVRYFGGILLGTNGLRRMYGSGALNVLQLSETIKMFPCIQVNLNIGYKEYPKIISLISNYNIKIINTIYEQEIKLEVYIKKCDYKDLYSKITNILKDNTKIIYLGEAYCELQKRSESIHEHTTRN